MKPVEILLIEDNPADAKLTMEAVREASVPSRISVVADGVEAMAFLRREGRYATVPAPDLIFMDLNLPRLGGMELLAELQADDRLKQIPIVVLTGSVDMDERVEIMKWPIQRHIIKPWDLDGYIACIHSALEDLI